MLCFCLWLIIDTHNLLLSQPTTQPSSLPTNQPSSLPTFQPSNLPMNQPSNLPKEQPSNLPTNQTSNLPTLQPSNPPTVQPPNKQGKTLIKMRSAQPDIYLYFFQQPTFNLSNSPLNIPSANLTVRFYKNKFVMAEKQEHELISFTLARPNKELTNIPTNSPIKSPMNAPSTNPTVSCYYKYEL